MSLLLVLIKTTTLFILTAMSEIAGCYAFYAVVRQGRHPGWLGVSVLLLLLFAWLLTLHPAGVAGRVYAAYGGVYIAASLFWMWRFEGVPPDRWDVAGATLCLIGAGTIMCAPR